ncbi:hypothetical protein Rsub_04653 [Raphidocelis subcapitata]|uniref:DM2 domain-containing protein n=1 Tax=Raphidocelis subcapitata TaxID=307507 RepID=A0A2V0NX69_9CHLO|nr:hypothetical protein Rsub_04653 [Raphidocelis subcapitata]|eukprot:GBF91929.1 hypothetical protein Rsub_04653 [Raphidocelis subcapitata]
MASDELVKERLLGLLKGLGEADLQTTTEKMLRKQLEKELGEDLSGKKELIRAEVTAFLQGDEEGGQEEAEGEEEEEEEEEGAGGGKKRGGGGGGGFSQRQCVLSEEMQAFLGTERMPRTQVVKEIWAYIKAHDLQDPKNRRNIVLDEKLATLFTHPVTMFSMNKQLSRHVKAADAVTNGSDDEGGGGGGGGSAAKKPRARSGGARKRPAAGGGGGGGSAAKKPRGMYGEVALSDELAAVTGRHRMTRSDLTKWFWAYVRQHELQDPSDKSYILSDATLQSLFGESRFKGFGFQKFIKPHVLGKAAAEAEAEDGGGASEAEGDDGAEAEANGGGEGVKQEEGVKEEEEEEGAGLKEEPAEEAAAEAVKAEEPMGAAV